MTNQSGNALFLILIAVAMLAALTITVTRSGSVVEESGSSEQSRIQSTQIMRYASAMSSAVNDLILRGCSENDISFENAADTNYVNANSPADQSCHIFEPEGAGLVWRNFSTARLGETLEMVITGQIALYGQYLGSADTEADLILAIPVSASLCTDINAQLGLSTDAADITSNINDWEIYYTGSFTNTYELGNGNGKAAAMTGKSAGCIIDDDGQPALYQVLLAR